MSGVVLGCETKNARTGIPHLPAWVPEAAQYYLAHTANGLPIRHLARESGCHASTVLRQIRRVENLRDDPLIDEALQRLSETLQPSQPRTQQDRKNMMPNLAPANAHQENAEKFDREAAQILRRLCEPGAVLAIAGDMDKAVIVREGSASQPIRTAIVSREMARMMALKDWINCQRTGRIARYEITQTGRIALNRLLAMFENSALGLTEKNPRRTQAETTRKRSNSAESPLLVLARRREKCGKKFLTEELVAAGERLREDFELSQLEPGTDSEWFKSIAAGIQKRTPNHVEGGLSGPARQRLSAALSDLGPGLADVALRCCCYLEGLESTEKRMGWSARSGKIVLRIALQRLRLHYDSQGEQAAMIG